MLPEIISTPANRTMDKQNGRQSVDVLHGIVAALSGKSHNSGVFTNTALWQIVLYLNFSDSIGGFCRALKLHIASRGHIVIIY